MKLKWSEYQLLCLGEDPRTLSASDLETYKLIVRGFF